MLRSAAVALALALALTGCSRDEVPRDQPTVPLAASGSYRIDPSLFAPDGEGGTRESLMVIGGDQDAVVAALRAAGERWSYVTETGEDLSLPTPDPARLEEAASADVYTPNFVFDVSLASRGPALFVDCKGVVAPAMARTFVQIVSEELRERSVEDVVLADAGRYTGAPVV